jgi:hypothetical protein
MKARWRRDEANIAATRHQHETAHWNRGETAWRVRQEMCQRAHSAARRSREDAIGNGP